MNKSYIKIFTLFFSLCLSTALYADNGTKDFTKSAKMIEENLRNAVALNVAGKYDDASTLVSDTYFDIFEGQGLEAAVGIRSPTLKTQLENQFGELRVAMAHAQPSEVLTAKADVLSKRLQASIYELKEDDSWWDKFLSSFIIIVREGFEAILIVGAIAAFLVKTKKEEHLSVVRSSTLVAIALSFVLAALFQVVLHVSSAQQELFEGATMLLACGVLFVVGHWLISQAESAHWMRYVKGQISDAIGTQSRRAIWLTCFLAVFREGAEVVLFYQALWASSGPATKGSVIGGFLCGCFALFLIFFFYKKSVLKIPMRPFFRVTSALLYFLSITMAGKAIVEMQAGGYLSVTRIDSLPSLGWIGFYPTLEHLVFQGLIVASLLVSVGWIYLRKYQEKLKVRRHLELETEMNTSLPEVAQ